MKFSTTGDKELVIYVAVLGAAWWLLSGRHVIKRGYMKGLGYMGRGAVTPGANLTFEQRQNEARCVQLKYWLGYWKPRANLINKNIEKFETELAAKCSQPYH